MIQSLSSGSLHYQTTTINNPYNREPTIEKFHLGKEVLFSNAQECSAMLSNAQQCLAMLSNAQQCSTANSNAETDEATESKDY